MTFPCSSEGHTVWWGQGSVVTLYNYESGAFHQTVSLLANGKESSRAKGLTAPVGQENTLCFFFLPPPPSLWKTCCSKALCMWGCANDIPNTHKYVYYSCYICLSFEGQILMVQNCVKAVMADRGRLTLNCSAHRIAAHVSFLCLRNKPSLVLPTSISCRKKSFVDHNKKKNAMNKLCYVHFTHIINPESNH